MYRSVSTPLGGLATKNTNAFIETYGAESWFGLVNEAKFIRHCMKHNSVDGHPHIWCGNDYIHRTKYHGRWASR